MRILLSLGLALTVCACGSGGGGSGASGPIVPFLPATFTPATVVLGQGSFTGAVPNAGGLDGGTLSGPTAAIEAGGSVWVADALNHRVLRYAGLPSVNGAGASSALGQPDLFSGSAATSATTMNQPVGLVAAGGRLYVSDFGNHRVLIFSGLPANTGVAASAALGQGDLSSNIAGSNQARLTNPVGIDAGGGRFVLADAGNHRVMVWNSLPTVNGQPADLVLGQAAFGDSTVNAGGAASASSLSNPFGVWTDGVRLVVADKGNNRILVWTTFPTTNGQAADLVLGQPSFSAVAPGGGASGARQPSGVTSNGVQLVVADGDNHRVLVWNTFPTASAQGADVVLGQSTFLNTAPNDDDQDLFQDATPSARTLNGGGGFLFAGLAGKRLWVGDFRNNRVLRLDAP